MGCGGNNQTLRYRHQMQDRVLPAKQVKSLQKWAHGAVARRRVRKLVQVLSIASQKKPIYLEGHLVPTSEVLLTEEQVAHYFKHIAPKNRLCWNTREIDIGKGRKYVGEWTKDRMAYSFEGLGTIRFEDGSVYQGFTKKQVFEGKGRMTHANGDVYQGEWKGGKANGKGVFVD